MWNKDVPFSILLGKTLTSILVNDDSIVFNTDDGNKYLMSHHQNCCEHVYIEDLCGDVQECVGTTVILAEEVSYEGETLSDSYGDSHTWTYYRLGTQNGGDLSIRWYGSSNGYYSESVSFELVDEEH